MTTLNEIKCDLSKVGSILLIDKPLDWTSFDVVKKVKVLLNVRKVGHAGTLDPKATGLLIVCTNEKTKSVKDFFDLDKEYIGTLKLGIRTPSFDEETQVIEMNDTSGITENQLKDLAKKFIGKQKQIPPMYSATKCGGKPLYEYARKGKVVERSERDILIHAFDILKFENPFVDFKILCSKGTYIRSIANDFGIRLGCGATLVKLRRIRIGDYHVNDSISMEELIQSKEKISNQIFL